MDHLTPKRRSENMALIKAGDTVPEMIVRRLVHRLGYRFRLHRRDLPGKPDLVLPRHKAVVFVHGCFWHQHAAADCKTRPPRSNQSYWLPKLKRNVERDAESLAKLRNAGWRPLVVWECETKDVEKLSRRLTSFFQD